MKNKNGLFLFLCMLFLLTSCGKSYVPRPYGYQRIALPDTSYTQLSGDFPYSFLLSDNAQIICKPEPHEKYWIDVYYPALNAKIHCSYKPIQHNLAQLSDESQKFVYKHAQMADAIPEHGFENTEKHVYGVLFELRGNTASPIQFILTDSVNHFFRAALYFNCTPNQDSLDPVIDYMHTDVIRMVESFEWK